MVRIVEFVQELPFDITDDIKAYMQNDKLFYRKHYYPSMCTLQSEIQKEKFDANARLMPMIEKGCDAYNEKYDISKKYITDEIKKSLQTFNPSSATGNRIDQ